MSVHSSVRSLFYISLFLGVPACTGVEPKEAEAASISSGFPIKGLSMVAPRDQIDGHSLLPISNINANSISLMPYGFFSMENPEVRFDQHGQHWGENIDGVSHCIRLAHEKNLDVMVKPHLWIGRGMYTGEFTLSTEKQWQIWENSYLNYVLHFARIADSLKSEVFCIATELGAAIQQRPRYWSALIDTVRKIYKGKLTYAANWDDYEHFPFWDKLDYIGVDAYFPLADSKTPSVDELQQAWDRHTRRLGEFSSKHDRPILFTEYGYRNVDHTGKEPWKENEGNRNDKAQANALEALYQSFAGKQWFAGGFVWKWYVGNSSHRNQSIDFTPQNKAAAEVIRNWYGK